MMVSDISNETPERRAARLATQRAYYAKNKTACNAASIAWKLSHPWHTRGWKRSEASKAQQRAWRKEYYTAHPKKTRNSKLKTKYHLTIESYDRVLAQQNGACAICQSPPGFRDHLDVDHDHATSVVRGLLCNGCNTGLGSMKESPDLMRAAADYLCVVPPAIPRFSLPKRRQTRCYRMSAKFGITAPQYDWLLKQQGGGCRICHRQEKPDRALSIDHDHTTTIVRGLLCITCNLGIGQFRDDPVRLRAASAYLERHMLSPICF